MTRSSLFHNPGHLLDDELELVLARKILGDPARELVPAYEFQMQHVKTKTQLGRIGLRLGNSEYIQRYAGHIGYSVVPEHRGHRYAARSCKLLLPLALSHGLNPLWITCNPDNWPSRRTCEILGAEYVETVELPEDCDMYRIGERRKCRYRLDL